MSRFVTDTHALVWHMTLDARLSPLARDVFRDADKGINQILVPSIILVEMVYLVEKGRLKPDWLGNLFSLLSQQGKSYRVAPLDEATVVALMSISRAAVPDMPDRIIAATARQLDLPLISRDAWIRACETVTTIW